MKQNPWLGLASYDEQAVAQGYKFCGRERAINELYSIVDNNLLTTLYGKSGIGKSSLLQAGVFPHLRTDNYLPVMIRLGAGIADNYSYTTIVMDAVRKAVAEVGGRCVATQEGEAACEEERLWHFFHSTEFQSAGGDTLFPVIVLDQFEELYYRDKQQLSALLKALYLLVDDSPLSSSDEDEVPNYRIVLSIREDDLFHLEDSIDKLRLTEMKYNRYRLRELTDDEARDIILLPGASLFSPSEADAIADRIIQEAKAGSEEISTAVLSLLCSRIYYACPTLTDSSASTGITLQRITEFFRQAEGNFLKSFYDDIIKELKSPAKWYYIEDTLVTDEGRRNSVLKSEFDKRVPNSDFLFRGEKSMLRCITTAGTDEPRVEIIHDMLARQMMSSRNERKLQEQAKALRKQRITAIAIILLAIVLGAVFYTQYRSIVAERNSMLKMQSHYIAEKAEKLIEYKTPFHAARLLLTVLPQKLNKLNRPYVVDAGLLLQDIDNKLRHSSLIIEHSINSISISPNGKHLITTSADSTARMWNIQTGKQVGETMKHDNYVNSALFSPDGNYIVTASWDKTAKIWDAKTGKQVGETMKHERYVNSTQFSPDGNYIVTASDDNTAKIWDAKTGKQVGETMKHERYVNSAQFSPDGNHIVTVSDDSTTIVWDAKTGKQVGETMKHENEVTSAQFSPDWNYIVTASDDSTAIVWDAKTGKQVGETMKHENEVTSAQFSPDGKYIVTASDDKTAKIWDAQTGKQVGETMRHERYVRSAQFSPDGNYIVTASDDNTAKIWNAKTGKQVGETMRHERYVRSAQFSPDGKHVVTKSGDYTANVWSIYNNSVKTTITITHKEQVRATDFMQDSINFGDVIFGDIVSELVGHSHSNKYYKGPFITNSKERNRKFLRHEDHVNSVQFSPDGKYIVTASDDSTAIVWNAKTRVQVGETMKHEGSVHSAQFSPGGEYIVTASNDLVTIWDAKTGKQVGETMKHEDWVTSAQFSPDGNYIVTASADSTAIVWGAKTGRQVGETMEHRDYVYSAQFSPNGKYIVTASDDSTARIWDALTGGQVGKTMEHHSYVYSARFSPDGKYIVTTSSENHNAKIWDIQTGEQVGETIKHDNEVYYATYSPNGKYIVTSSYKTTKICDAQTKKQIGKTMMTGFWIRSLAFSPNGEFIVTTSHDKTAKIWDVKTGEQVGDLKHEDNVNSAQFSPDGKYIVTASDDGTAGITEFIPLQELIDKYRELFRDLPLTEEELIEYNFK